jgi:hypothetical protein
MSFEEICPIWTEKLNSGLTEKDKILLIPNIVSWERPGSSVEDTQDTILLL